MCISFPQPVHIDKMIAYKLMSVYINEHVDGEHCVESFYAGNSYSLGKVYEADLPRYRHIITPSEKYDKGFHAYDVSLKAARRMLPNSEGNDADMTLKIANSNPVATSIYTVNMTIKIVKVELLDVFLLGMEYVKQNPVHVFVANKCKFLEIIVK